MTSQVSIAVIGAGSIGPRHAQTVIEDSDARLTAIVDPAPDAAKVAQDFGVPHYTSVEELVNSPDKPAGAIICTPNHTHVPIGIELLKAGIDILVEKPISTDVESGKDLVSCARQNDVKILVGHHRRFNSYITAAKETITSGALGDIIAVNGLWATQKPLQYFESAEWRKHKTGGVILINMVHEIDLLHELLGPITRVYAEKTISRRGFDAEEGAAITLRFESGAVGTFLLSDNVPSPHNFEAATGENPLIPRTGEDFYRIFGSKAMMGLPEVKLWWYDADKEQGWHEKLNTVMFEVTVESPFKKQLAHFIEVVRRQQEPKCDGEAGVRAIAVCEALKKSLESAHPVDIALE